MSAPVETFQAQWELEQLVALVERSKPSSVLEIGAWHGGTLWHWLQVADTVVVVDDEMRMADEWWGWAREADTALHLLRGRSQDPKLVAAAEWGAPYDLVFIDADHTYEAVKADWENYGPLVSSGGVVAFHDVVERPGYGVSRLWNEIKARPGARWMEIGETVEPENESRCGIGLVW